MRLGEVMAMARGMDREQALNRVQRESAEQRVRYILTYEPKLPSIPEIPSELGGQWWTGTED